MGRILYFPWWGAALLTLVKEKWLILVSSHVSVLFCVSLQTSGKATNRNCTDWSDMEGSLAKGPGHFAVTGATGICSIPNRNTPCKTSASCFPSHFNNDPLCLIQRIPLGIASCCKILFSISAH